MTEHRQDIGPEAANATGDGGGFGAVISTAGAWQCRCAQTCKPAEAARCLYARTLEALSVGEPGPTLAGEMLGALAMVVAGQKSAQGHALCQTYTAALAAGNHDAALDACRGLIDLGSGSATRGWDELPGHI